MEVKGTLDTHRKLDRPEFIVASSTDHAMIFCAECGNRAELVYRGHDPMYPRVHIDCPECGEQAPLTLEDTRNFGPADDQ